MQKKILAIRIKVLKKLNLEKRKNRPKSFKFQQKNKQRMAQLRLDTLPPLVLEKILRVIKTLPDKFRLLAVNHTLAEAAGNIQLKSNSFYIFFSFRICPFRYNQNDNCQIQSIRGTNCRWRTRELLQVACICK